MQRAQGQIAGMAVRPILLGVATVAIALIALAAHGLTSLDPLPDELLSLIAPMDTVYAAGYSPDAFRRAIRTGTTEEEVRALLGPPLHVDAQPHGHWDSYSRPGSRDKNSWSRVICYREGRVEGFMVGLSD
jgi:hypothetical protein